ncbi:MATE family efflux transporter [Anaerosphaera multitolerans]|nr:MATE family efflux transporter [Anaerosphaera multitolerans]
MKKEIRKNILKYAIPGILGLVANSLYIVVDGIFVAKMLGPKPLAAVTTVVPVVEILIALSLMISTGGGIYISIFQGKGDLKKSREYFNHALLFSLVSSVVILVLSLLFREKIVTVLGATPDIHADAVEYFTWFILFVPIFMLNYALGTWIRNDGKPALAMATQIVGAVVNIVLDYVFMGPLKMGLAGAAIATGLGPVSGVLLLAPHFLLKKGDLYLEKFKLQMSKIKEILIGGLPSFSLEFSLGLMTFFCNIFISRKIGVDGLTSFGVVGYINLIFLSVFLGMGQGTQPLVSRFYGQQDFEDIRNVYYFSLKISVALGVFCYVFLLVAARPLTSIFIDSNNIELTNATVTAIKLFFVTFPCTGINVITANLLAAKHSVTSSILISLLRSCIFLVPTLLVLNIFSNSLLIWLAVPITEAISVIATFILWKRDSYNMTNAYL